MIRLEDVTLTVGARELLTDATLHVHPGDHLGVVGANGVGKTSLLRLVLGQIECERGTVSTQRGATLGYLPQKAVSGSTATVWDEARSGMARIEALRARLEAATIAVEQGEDGAVERLGEATEAFRLAGGYAADERIGEVLHGLGFGPDDWQRTCDTFSGGWQMRIALAKLLLSDPDVLVLDEPTNHLDLAARSWLSGYLSRSSRTLLVVSHDRHLLDTVCTRICEVRHRQLTTFSGNLTAWLAERALREEQIEAERAKQQAEIDKLQRFVDRFGAKATKASQANARKKQLDRIERIEAPERDKQPVLRLPDAPGCSAEVLTLTEASLGWPDAEAPVVTGVDLRIERGERWMVLGPNGTGKSTLLHALSGRNPLMGGRRRVGKDVRIGVFGQDLAQDLPADATPLDQVLAAAPTASETRARSALGALGLRGDAVFRRIGDLSGGEKARVVLARFALQPFNVLLLDEPTNHLDAVTVDVLVEALKEFEGALVVVTHDRYLVEQLGTHVVRVVDGSIDTHPGVLPSDLEPIPSQDDGGGSTDEGPSQGALDHAERKRRHRERRQAQRRFAKLSKRAETLEEKMGEVEAALLEAGGDYEEAARLGEALKGHEAELEEVFEELMVLEEQIADG